MVSVVLLMQLLLCKFTSKLRFSQGSSLSLSLSLFSLGVC